MSGNLCLSHLRRVRLGSIKPFALTFNSTRHRNISSKAEQFGKLATESKFQVYVSRTSDPFINLSIEHYLLQKSPVDSFILFLYVNKPCIVIGRNQNPWLEINMRNIGRDITLRRWDAGGEKVDVPKSRIELVRRRTGGGTVFHDEGNVNYCVVLPKDEFTRDKHAEMVTRAIRAAITPRARVNERHDIVLDQGEEETQDSTLDPEDTHRTSFETSGKTPLKISGSAYKMTRQRALHHGTCLVNSPNLELISPCLKSGAAPYIKALGVDSVRSPVTNLFTSWQPGATELFERSVIARFCELYGIGDQMNSLGLGGSTGALRLPESGLANADSLTYGELDDRHADLPEIQAGVAEMRGRDWTFGQTPRFTFSTSAIRTDLSGESQVKSALLTPAPDRYPDGSERDGGPWPMPEVRLEARHGAIEDAQVTWPTFRPRKLRDVELRHRQAALIGVKIHEIESFDRHLTADRTRGSFAERDAMRRALAAWMNSKFGMSSIGRGYNGKKA